MKIGGAFCEIYGFTIKNGVLEYILENQDLDFAIGDMAKEIGISRPKAYEVIKEFLEKGYILESRIIGKTQLFKLNKENNKVKFFLKNFEECLNLVVEEHHEKEVVLAQINLGDRNINQEMNQWG